MKKKGFTLIEIIVVLIILSIASTLALSSYFSWIARSNASEATLNLKSYADSLDGYFYGHGSDPHNPFACNTNVLTAPSSSNFTYNIDGNSTSCMAQTNPLYSVEYIVTATVTPGDGQGSRTGRLTCPKSYFSFDWPDSSIVICRNFDGTRTFLGSGIFEGMFSAGLPS
ncbi:MAG: prepilin-type N-terminal cleavage/methylation domain-containing protein [Candidatus Omnitrophica bacterium]|nr:prepilin-type N-terminal cleavage/methylation domain-containing protein [Candidatus Omnitrophota bacterium]